MAGVKGSGGFPERAPVGTEVTIPSHGTFFDFSAVFKEQFPGPAGSATVERTKRYGTLSPQDASFEFLLKSKRFSIVRDFATDFWAIFVLRGERLRGLARSDRTFRHRSFGLSPSAISTSTSADFA
jgi:hypothetical protein